MKLFLSTIEVPASEVNLGLTQWNEYIIPYDKKKEFQAFIDAQEKNLKADFKENKSLAEICHKEVENFRFKKGTHDHWRHFKAFQKLECAMELINKELTDGAYEKLVIFAHHADVMKFVQISLSKFKPMTLYAKSNPLRVESNLKKFNTPGSRARVFISTIKAANSPSIKFGSVNFAFFLEQELNPYDNLAAIKKLTGEKVYVRNFRLEDDKLDQKLVGMIDDETLNLFKGETDEQVASVRRDQESDQNSRAE